MDDYAYPVGLAYRCARPRREPAVRTPPSSGWCGAANGAPATRSGRCARCWSGSRRRVQRVRAECWDERAGVGGSRWWLVLGGPWSPRHRPDPCPACGPGGCPRGRRRRCRPRRRADCASPLQTDLHPRSPVHGAGGRDHRPDGSGHASRRGGHGDAGGGGAGHADPAHHPRHGSARGWQLRQAHSYAGRLRHIVSLQRRGCTAAARGARCARHRAAGDADGGMVDSHRRAYRHGRRRQGAGRRGRLAVLVPRASRGGGHRGDSVSRAGRSGRSTH